MVLVPVLQLDSSYFYVSEFLASPVCGFLSVRFLLCLCLIPLSSVKVCRVTRVYASRPSVYLSYIAVFRLPYLFPRSSPCVSSASLLVYPHCCVKLCVLSRRLSVSSFIVTVSRPVFAVLSFASPCVVTSNFLQLCSHKFPLPSLSLSVFIVSAFLLSFVGAFANRLLILPRVSMFPRYFQVFQISGGRCYFCFIHFGFSVFVHVCYQP